LERAGRTGEDDEGQTGMREKAMSTATLGIGHPLKRVSQSRAAAASFEVAKFERGGVGSDVAHSLWSVLCHAVRTTS
jgi:hypothetical protein